MNELSNFKLPSQILLFFNLGNAHTVNGVKRPHSIGDFINASGGIYNPEEVRRVCQTFINEGLLIPTGSTSLTPILSETFYNYKIERKYLEYGSYDFVASGFSEIRNHFTNAVRPIIVKTATNMPDLGTCFLIKNDIILTARHCVENMNNIFISDISGKPLIPSLIAVPVDARVDIAALKFDKDSFAGTPAFILDDVQILDDVLTMGYPPIPGFDAIQFAETSKVNAHLKVSKGSLVGKDKSYLDAQEYLLINAKVKGGNSGGPIINRNGCVGGMLVHIPTDSQNTEELDSMGYGVAIPVEQINDFVNQVIQNDTKNFTQKRFKVSDFGFSTM